MGFFTRDEGKKDDGSRKAESERLTGKLDPKSVAKKTTSLKSFVIGLKPGEKLANLPAERFEEGLKALLPKGSKVARAVAPALTGRDASVRFFELSLPAQELPEALSLLLDKGLLDGQIQLALDQCVVLCDATSKSAQVALVAESLERSGMRFTIRTDSPEVLVQYPPIDVHKRWLADDDYRAAYGRWRTQRSDETKPVRWHGGWAPAAADDAGPPWVRLKPRDGKTDEYVLDFDDSMLLRFAFQGAVIRIERFNLKLLANRLTGELATYRSMPLSLESIPKEVQDRINRDPERFKALREPGKFGTSFDLVRTAYEELGGDYYQIELPATPPLPLPVPATPAVALDSPTGAITAGATAAAPAASKESISLQSGPMNRPADPFASTNVKTLPVVEKKAPLPPPRLGTVEPEGK
ncbi:MAG: hypothetical protein ACAI25_13870 [Planctomycetota bacterium]